ncbi:hypothetical protein [Arthrobacter sp. 31Y]|uniref:hypothetical protein n=1 Tax=Arthrobacter sp. 31Y TaxID=1115632 RepID=UPI000466E5CC|nr:hypothetical protein [Arthrobacter sp. 31Y]
MKNPALILQSERPPRLSADPQQVSWSGGEKPSEIFTAAYVPAERWNGWAKPYFSQDECLRLAATQAEFNDSLKFEYDSARQVWQEFNEEEDYRSDCRTMLVDGVPCHQIGSGFTWMELPDVPQRRESEVPDGAVREVRSADSAAKRRSTPLQGEPVSGLAIPGTLDAGYGPLL